jgi:DNA/RNA-binding domain of Phe-tRNA-synthetase-like protein
MRVTVSASLPFKGWAFGLVIAGPLRVKESSPAQRACLEEALARCALPPGDPRALPPAGRGEAVRALLRKGGFKPAGRNKPASEYLAQAAREGRFPLINGLVDANNLLSVETGYPISLLDAEAFASPPMGGASVLDGLGHAEAIIRLGAPNERYVFNQSGQEIELEGLICLCSSEAGPLGNAVKDSMRAKLKEGSRFVLGCVYAPPDEGLARACEAFLARLLAEGRAEAPESSGRGEEEPRGAWGILDDGASEALVLEC